MPELMFSMPAGGCCGRCDYSCCIVRYLVPRCVIGFAVDIVVHLMRCEQFWSVMRASASRPLQQFHCRLHQAILHWPAEYMESKVGTKLWHHVVGFMSGSGGVQYWQLRPTLA